MIKQAKTEYYTNVVELNKSNSKMLWDYLRQIAPKGSKQLPSSVKDSDTKLTDPQDILNIFILLITEDKVTKLLSNLEENKATGF